MLKRSFFLLLGLTVLVALASPPQASAHGGVGVFVGIGVPVAPAVVYAPPPVYAYPPPVGYYPPYPYYTYGPGYYYPSFSGAFFYGGRRFHHRWHDRDDDGQGFHDRGLHRGWYKRR